MRLIRYGSQTLFVQNLCILIIDLIIFANILLGQIGSLLFYIIILYTVFTLDLIGFTMIAIGLLRHPGIGYIDPKNFKFASLGIFGWIAARLFIQIGILLDITSDRRFDLTEDLLIFIFAFSSLCLFLSGLTRIHTRYLQYTALNFGAVWLTFIAYLLEIPGYMIEITAFIKILTIPILGVIVFRELENSEIAQPKTEKYTTEAYPKDQ